MEPSRADDDVVRAIQCLAVPVGGEHRNRAIGFRAGDAAAGMFAGQHAASLVVGGAVRLVASADGAFRCRLLQHSI